MQKPDSPQADQHSPVMPAIHEKRESIPGVNEEPNRPDLSLDMSNFFEDDVTTEPGYLTLEFDIETVVSHVPASQIRLDRVPDADQPAPPPHPDFPGSSGDEEVRVPGYLTLELETDAFRAAPQSGAGLKSQDGQRRSEVEGEDQSIRKDDSSLEMPELASEDELPAPEHLTLELDIAVPDIPASSGQTKAKSKQSDLSRRP